MKTYFRVWNTQKHIMHSHENWIVVKFINGEFFEFYGQDDNPYEDNGVITNDGILMQFTGLVDINNQKLFDGDIFQDNNMGITYRVYAVKGGFAHSIPQFKSTFTGEAPFPLQPLSDEQTISWFESTCKIIGNIYENPELIKS